MFDTNNSPSVLEYELTVNGLNNTLELVRTQTLLNANGTVANGTGNSSNRGAVLFSAPIINFGIARSKLAAGSSFGGDPNYFLDYLIPVSVLFPILGINANSSLRFLFFSSANNNNYNKDFTSLSDSMTIASADVRAKLAVTQTAVSTPAIVQVGQTASFQGTITVTNTGKSSASTIFAVTSFAFDKLASFTVTNKTAGMTSFTSLTQTLTWNIGNLAAGASVTITYIATGLFNTAGQRTLDSKNATGVDLFTGAAIASNNSSAAFAVFAVGRANGTVIDGASGLPLTGVNVAALTLPGLANAGSAVTDIAGIYSTDPLPAGSFRLQFSYTNYSPFTSDITIAANEVTTTNVLLQPIPATVQGVVSAVSGGAPIAGAAVNLTNWLGVHIAQATADAAGAYSIAGIVPGYYRIAFTAPNFQLSESPLTLTPAENRNLNAALQSNPGSAAGVVTSASGTPIAGAFVEALDNRNNVLCTTTTAADGSYRFDTLAPADNDRLRVSEANFVTNVIGFRVIAGQTTTVNAVLSPLAGSIGGVITDAGTGTAIAGASIRVFNSEGVTLQTGSSAPDGSYVIPSLGPGSYSVVFAAEGYAGKTVGAIVNSGAQSPVSVSLELLAGAISGTVTLIDSTPIEDVVIRVFSNNIIIGRVATAANGSFLIGNIAPGNYVVSARPDGFGGETLGAAVNPGETTELNFRLVPSPGSVTGLITDENGSPLAGAVISVQNNVDGGPVILTRIISESDGIYRISNLASGSYILNVLLANYQNQFSAIRVLSNQTATANFTMLPSPGAISGTVVDTSGAAIFGAGIEIRVTNANGITVSSLFTDPNGRFLAEHLKPGIYTVVAGAANFQQATATCSVLPDGVAAIGLVMSPDPGAIQGIVIDAVTGSGLFGSIVNVNDQVGFLAGSVITDDNGFFRISGLAPGSYTLVATENNYQSETFGAIVLTNADTPVNFALKPNPAAITGQLQPAPASSVVQLFNTNNVQIATVAAFPDGSFTFNNVQEGNYYVTATAAGFTSAIVGANALPGQTTSVIVPLQVNPGTISGTVTDTNGNPIPAASVKVLNGNESVRGIGQVQADGTYTIGNLPAGVLNVIASAPLFSSETTGITVNPGQSVTGINFQLQADPGTVNGQITDAVTGQPIPGADVELRQLTANGLGVASGSATAFGNYQFNGINPGVYTVIARASGYSINSAGATVRSGQSTVASILLNPLSGELSGLITDTAGNPISGENTEFKLYTKEGLLLETAFASQQGTVRLIELPPNEYVVNVSSPGFTSASVGAFIRPGLTTSITVVLSKQTSFATGRVVNAATGAPLSGALINIYDLSSLIFETAYTDQDGRYTINGLPPGAFTLSAVADGFGSATAAILTLAGTTSTADFALTPSPGSVTGFVSDITDGASLQGALIRIFDAASSAIVGTVLSGVGGAYRFDGLAPGSYIATVDVAGYAPEFGGFDITASVTTRFSYALTRLPGMLSGKITRALDNSNITGCRVQLHQFNSFGPVITSQLSDSNGDYDFGDVAPTNYIVAASIEGFVSNQTSALVLSGESTRANIMLLQNQTVIEGPVTDGSSGAPVTNAPVVVVDDVGVIGGSGVTNPQGQYSVPSTPGGEQTVIVSKPGKRTTTADVLQLPGQQQVVPIIVQNQTGATAGVVTDRFNGTPVPGAIVSVLQPTTGIILSTVITNGVGKYVLGGLIPGQTYTITATSPSYGSASIAAVGNTQGNTIALPVEFGTLQGTITDTSGRPLRKALAEITTAKRIVIRQTVSNAAGFYAFTNVSAGTVYARFSFPGKQTVILQPIIFNSQTTILNVMLEDEDDE
ncbi:carboxypeptidase regulatory-like domain-containing protein [Paenibacillus sp. NEAU-GSW1]|uniref:carboxypeptidase regulatory-like domain-containing protein n=1 Tax=Paenibacillus sp. NEAU-GSW1 TaxID=2682486 RepID=UPI0012E23A3F|nr:carboxypeptidase regulatory-like domain-containing protein [Paenibacillus sp. NEAU-GSW1]MUT65619.1 hypothetical protein [Paenibacillus sp. NEAU-GSW1]